MRLTLERKFSLLFCLSFSLINPIHSNCQERSEPQLVRVIYAQGEVKFSPGKNGRPNLSTEWMKADTGLTLGEGYSLATEQGRAQVEFENGSVAYLAEYSVLQFDKLQIKDGATATKLNLLTGTATFAHVSKGQDLMTLVTPTMNMHSNNAFTLRFDSTLNGTVVRALDAKVPLAQPKNKSVLQPGETVAYVNGFRFELKGPAGNAGSDAWDKWVDAQHLERAAAIQKGLQESGLKEPIPGLADLAQNGRFFDCPPYGKCWEPNPQPPVEALADAAAEAGGASASAPLSNGPRSFVINRTLINRCPMETWMYSVGRPSRPGLLAANEPEMTFKVSSFPWSGCFAGTWLVDSCWNVAGFMGFDGFPTFGTYARYPVYARYCPHRMIYVVGRRHKKPPCRTVHTPHGFGFVPRHPLDQKGKPPINAKSGVFVLASGKNGVEGKFEPTPTKGLQWETTPPREFSSERNLLANAATVAPPVIEGRMIRVASNPAQVAAAIQASKQEESRIVYDYKSKNFVASHPATNGATAGMASRSSSGAPMVVAHVGSRGVSGGVTGHGGGWSGSSGGGSAGGHAGGGSSDGSSSGGHSGGGSSSSGGSASASSFSGGGSASSGHH